MGALRRLGHGSASTSRFICVCSASTYVPEIASSTPERPGRSRSSSRGWAPRSWSETSRRDSSSSTPRRLSTSRLRSSHGSSSTSPISVASRRLVRRCRLLRRPAELRARAGGRCTRRAPASGEAAWPRAGQRHVVARSRASVLSGPRRSSSRSSAGSAPSDVIFATGDLSAEVNDGHVLRIYRWSDLERLFSKHSCRVVSASAANFLSSERGVGGSLSRPGDRGVSRARSARRRHAHRRGSRASLSTSGSGTPRPHLERLPRERAASRRRGFLREMIELVCSDSPDVVCLQEVPVWGIARLEEWSSMQALAVVARAPRIPGRAGARVTRWNQGFFRSAFVGQANAILVSRSLTTEERGHLQISDPGRERRIVQAVGVAGRYLVANLHANRGLEVARLELERARAFAEAAARAGRGRRPGGRLQPAATSSWRATRQRRTASTTCSSRGPLRPHRSCGRSSDASSTG